jgi:hypothetical protein
MITVQQKLSLTTIRKGRKRLETRDTEKPARPVGSIPRISRLMALAIKYQGMLDRGEVAGVTELAKLCHVTQPRMTQILNLNCLSPSIQEKLLFLPESSSGKSKMHERALRFACTLIDWESQANELSQMG